MALSTELAIFIGTLIGTVFSVLYANQRAGKVHRETREAAIQRDRTLSDDLAARWTKDIEAKAKAQQYDIQALKNENTALAVEMSEQREQAEKKLTELRETIAKQSGEIAALKETIAALEKRIEAITAEKASLANELDVERARSARLDAELTAARQKIERLEQRVQELEAENRVMDKLMDRLQLKPPPEPSPSVDGLNPS